MNKTYLIVGGASVVSLAVGAAGGYFAAKRKFDDTIEERIAFEVDETKKYYAVLLMQARDKPASLADLDLIDDAELARPEEDDEEEPTELTEADQEVIKKGRRTLAEANTALTNYQGFSQNQPQEGVVKSNIFSSAASPKRPIPPKDPESGRFVRKNDLPVDEPHLISQEHFLGSTNDAGDDLSDTYEQENLLYFVRDKTLIMVADNEVVDNGRVGEVNLTLFPEVPRDEPSIICVRNPGLCIDYEIKLTHESLTEYMGLGESDDDDEDEDSDNKLYYHRS